MKIDVEELSADFAYASAGLSSELMRPAVARLLRSILPGPGEVLVNEDGEMVKRKVLATKTHDADPLEVPQAVYTLAQGETVVLLAAEAAKEKPSGRFCYDARCIDQQCDGSCDHDGREEKP